MNANHFVLRQLLIIVLALLPWPAAAIQAAAIAQEATVVAAPAATARPAITAQVKKPRRVKAASKVLPPAYAAPVDAVAPEAIALAAAPSLAAASGSAETIPVFAPAIERLEPAVVEIVRPAPPVEAPAKAVPIVKALARPAASNEAILRAADEARGNVSGLGWEVTIESAERERITDTLMYDIKVRAFNVAGLSLAPPKYRGNKILMLNSNMWFYKPGLSKPVPISLRQKLMGDAAYGDIASTNYAEHYAATRLPDDVVDGKACYVFDLRAKAEKVTYDRIIYWVEKQRELGVKADYYTVSGKKFKSASMEYGNTIKLAAKPHPFLSRITMHGELLDGAVTYLHLRNPRIEPVPDYVFDLNLFMR